MRTLERGGLGAAAVLIVLVLPALNALPAGSALHISDFTLNLFGKFLAYAILALGIDLIWGYTGVLSLGHGVFFGLGAYAMGMHLMLEIGTQSVYRNVLPDFMVWNQVTELPLFWRPFYSAAFTLAAVVAVPAAIAWIFGFLTFRSRIRGVYFSIITQALALSAWLMFNRNSLNLGGTNGLSGFKTIFGFTLNDAGTQRGLYVATALCLCGAYLLCRWIIHSPAGKVLVAIRDSETRVLFAGYSPASFKLFVFVVSAVLAGVAEDRRVAFHRDDHLGGGGWARHPRGAGGRSRRGELAPEHPHDELPRSLAPGPGRPLHRRGPVLPRRRRGERAEVHRSPAAIRPGSPARGHRGSSRGPSPQGGAGRVVLTEVSR